MGLLIHSYTFTCRQLAPSAGCWGPLHLSGFDSPHFNLETGAVDEYIHTTLYLQSWKVCILACIHTNLYRPRLDLRPAAAAAARSYLLVVPYDDASLFIPSTVKVRETEESALLKGTVPLPYYPAKQSLVSVLYSTISRLFT